MSANSAISKFKMVNGLIDGILEEKNISTNTLFPKICPIDAETRQKTEKLLESRERIREEIRDMGIEDFTDDLNIANYFLSCKRFSKAIRYYDSALAKNAQSYSALCNKGFALYSISKLDEATLCYDEALKIYKNIPEAFFIKGKILFAKQKFSEAITQFHNTLELEPENIDAKYHIGKSLMRLGNISDAIEILESIVANKDHIESLMLLGKIFVTEKKFQRAISYIDRLLEISPNNIEARFTIAKSYENIKNINEAIKHFEKILSINPNHVEANLSLGKIYRNIENTNNALYYFDKILDISPNHAEASKFKIELLEKNGNIDEAINFCNNLIETSPNPSEYILKKGILLFNNSKTEEALIIFNEILEKVKTSNIALFYKAKIFSQKQQQQEALLCLEIILKAEPQNLNALKEALNVSINIGKYEIALEYANQLLREFKSESILEKKALLLSVLGKHEESGQTLIEIIKKNDHNYKAMYELGKTHLILNNFEKAVDFFDASLKKKPFNANALLKKSLALFSLQRYDSAVLCLEQISESDEAYNYAQYQKSKIQMIQGNIEQSLETLYRVTKNNEMFRFIALNDPVFENILDIQIFEKNKN